MPRAAGTRGDGGDLLGRFLDGSRGALARAISLVEDEAPGFQELLDGVLREGRGREPAVRVGVTGPPGAGKSTLVTALAARYREAGETVGIVAVDPTSPFSGGALLGDRIRMRDLSTDPGVFIRSMATRRGTGGLAVTTGEVVDLMDVFGFDRILVETVGVGQTELEVAGTAETVVVVLVPESGDGIQTMKAGLLEIADVFVINKADRPGADTLAGDLRGALDLRRDEEGSPVWRIPVVSTVATTGEGVEELEEAIASHGKWLEHTGEGERRSVDRARSRIRGVVEREIRRLVWRDGRLTAGLEAGARAVGRGEETPYSVSRRLVDRWMSGETG